MRPIRRDLLQQLTKQRKYRYIQVIQWHRAPQARTAARDRRGLPVATDFSSAGRGSESAARTKTASFIKGELVFFEMIRWPYWPRVKEKICYRSASERLSRWSSRRNE